MSFWSISANSAASIDTSNGLPSGIDNDQGTVRGGGNIGATDKFSADAVSLGVNRQVTVVSGINGVESALAAGAFNSGDQVIRRVTNDIAGVSNNALLSGGSNSANRDFSIKQVRGMSTYYYKTAVRTGAWNVFSGVFSPAVSVGNTGIWSQATDTDATTVAYSSGVDNAANPTASIPGELVYRDGSPEPVQDDYAAKTNY